MLTCRSFIRSAEWLLAALALTGSEACLSPERVRTPLRYEQGLVLVLPGVEGPSLLSQEIILGLEDGGVPAAMEVFDWSIPGAVLVNLADLPRNREQAQRLADRIVDYRAQHSGKPVCLIGHSGGGGLAVLGLEALPAGRQIDTAILLAPALSPDHNLATALARTRRGIHSFYSELDVGILKVGTTVFGAIDRQYGPSAGAVGFRVPEDLRPEERRLYDTRLHQVAWEPALLRYGVSGTHLGWASRQFAREYLAPIIRGSEPPGATSRSSQPSVAR